MLPTADFDDHAVVKFRHKSKYVKVKAMAACYHLMSHIDTNVSTIYSIFMER